LWSFPTADWFRAVRYSFLVVFYPLTYTHLLQDSRGGLKIWEMGTDMLGRSLEHWLNLLGSTTMGRLRLELSSPGGKDVKGPKHGAAVHQFGCHTHNCCS
jgi:hypothetical protein